MERSLVVLQGDNRIVHTVRPVWHDLLNNAADLRRDHTFMAYNGRLGALGIDVAPLEPVARLDREGHIPLALGIQGWDRAAA